MNPFFTVITPTIQRPALVNCCESVNNQEMKLWEHIVMVDSAPVNGDLIRTLRHPCRQFHICESEHKNFGNTCRHNAYPYARGEYIVYLDDDNWLADRNILRDIRQALMSEIYPDIAIFPIFNGGSWFYNEPPRREFTDTANFIVKRSLGQWPDGPDYQMDGIFIDTLVAMCGYKGFPLFRPIVIRQIGMQGQ